MPDLCDCVSVCRCVGVSVSVFLARRQTCVSVCRCVCASDCVQAAAGRRLMGSVCGARSLYPSAPHAITVSFHPFFP